MTQEELQSHLFVSSKLVKAHKEKKEKGVRQKIGKKVEKVN